MSVCLVARGEGCTPVYRQIRDVLSLEINAIYKATDALPSELELARRFRVKRHTLRRAIDELVAEGLVERQHGKGMFVLKPAVDYAIGELPRFTEILLTQARATSSTVIRKQLVPAIGGGVIFIETLRRLEARPFCIISHFLPYSHFSEIFEHYDAGSLHEFLGRYYGLELKCEENLISSVLPEADDAGLLNMPRHVPLLQVKSLNLNSRTNRPIEYAISRFRDDISQLSVKP